MPDSIFREGTYTLLDGALGTMLQKAGLKPGQRPEELLFSQPEKLTEVHRLYIDAGSDIICANTFGANGKKLEGSGYKADDVVRAAVRCAKDACAGTGVRVALDVGPLGEILEPVGTLGFEEAYALYAEMMRAGQEAGADVVLIETMTDLLEIKAAVLAAKEQTTLPVLASMSFEVDGRTFAGVSVEAFAATIPALGADAVGINCSLGPAAIAPLAERLCRASSVPVFVKPNAGLPDPATGAYTLDAAGFCKEMEGYLALGISAVGGCCGTEPAFISGLKALCDGKTPPERPYRSRRVLCSGTRVVEVDGVHPIGERINPTGKKRLQEALRSGDIALVQALAVEQEQSGAALLDVNVGTPGVDEVALLPRVVRAVQAVSSLPLVLDSANPAALEAALRVYNGKPLVNSTSGEADKMAGVLPLCKRYGAAVVGLTLDEDGIPSSADGRFAVAERILEHALAAGLPKEDIYIDCLTLTASAGEQPADETLRALRRVKEELGLCTLLGVSNVSFGLPNRPLVNETFLCMAMQSGLDLPILNPASKGMMDAVAAYRLLAGQDTGARAFVERFSAVEGAQEPAAPAQAPAKGDLGGAIRAGLKAEAAAEAKRLLQAGNDGLELVNTHMMPALDRVGEGFEKGTLFLPQLLAAAGAAQSAFEEIRNHFGAAVEEGPPVVVATVQGDVHDIGKNIARLLLENYGFRVIDLGRDVPPQRVVEAARDSGARVVGLSALMTTTLPAMEATVDALHMEAPGCKIMVGGAVLTPDYAQRIGADYYVKDAKSSVDAAREVYRQ